MLQWPLRERADKAPDRITVAPVGNTKIDVEDAEIASGRVTIKVPFVLKD